MDVLALEVVFAIIVSQFFIWFNVPLSNKKDSSPSIDSLTVWSTAMIGVAHGVPTWAAIDINSSANVKDIFVGGIGLCWNTVTDVFDNSGVSFDGKAGVEAKTSAATFYSKSKNRLWYGMFSLFHEIFTT